MDLQVKEPEGVGGKDPDGFGSETNYDYGFRVSNPVIARFLSVDPLDSQYPMLSSYQYASNSPIAGIDLDGLEFSLSTSSDGATYINTHFKILNSSSLSNENLKLLINEGVKPAYLDIMKRKYRGNIFRGWFTFEFVEFR